MVENTLRVLADPTRRTLLRLLHEEERNAIGLDELTDRLTRIDDASSAEDVEISLYHVHLPKLEDVGLIEYDERTGHVRYRPNQTLTELFSTGLVDGREGRQ